MELVVDGSPAVNMHRTRGVGRYVSRLIAALARYDPEFSILLPRTSQSKEFPGNCRQISYPSVSLNRAGTEWITGSLFSSGILSRDILFHATDFNVLPTGKFRKIATVYDTLAWHESTRMDRRVYLLWYRKFLSSCDMIICISETTKRDLIDERVVIDESRIHVIYPGTDHLIRSRTAVATRQGSPTFIVLGSADCHKNLGSILEAVGLVPEAKVYFIGQWHASQVRWFVESARRLRVSDNVSYEGYLSDDEVVTRLTRSFGLISMSSVEGFGLPVFEALRLQVPVLYNRANAVYQELLGGSGGMAVPCATVEELGGAMARLIRGAPKPDPVLQNLLGRLTWGKCAEEHWLLYTSILRT